MKRRAERLPRDVKELLEPFFPGFDFSRVRIYEGIPRYVVGRPVGYANWDKVYLKPGMSDLESIEGLALLAHEIAHCRQYQELGKWRFRRRYLQAYFKNLRLGMSHGEAYWNIPFEIEAREIEAYVLRVLNKHRQTDQNNHGMKQETQQEREYPHWTRVYLIVIIYTLALIIGLWVFSNNFK